MQFTKIVLLGAGLIALGACQMSETERGLAGAAGGAMVAGAAGYNPTTGALVGGAAGVLCDNVGACR